MPKMLKATALGHYSTGEAAQALGLSFGQLNRRIKQGTLPGPDVCQEPMQWLFSRKWVEGAKAAIVNN